MNFRRLYFSFLILSIFLVAQTLRISAQVDDIINVDSSIVRLNVGVVNRSGQPIKNLSSLDFDLFEDGVKQDISHFEPTVSPFSVVMILDMSGSTLGFRQTIQSSGLRFIDALAPDDRIAVIEFYDKINVLNDFTSDRRRLVHSIGAANGRGKTKLYNALEISLKKLSNEKNRRKAIIVLTDGVDTESRNADRKILSKFEDMDIPGKVNAGENKKLLRVLERARIQGVTIYPLALPTGDPAKLADPTPIQFEMFSIARARLKILAERTGGTLNTINRLEEMGKLYAEIAADVRALYTIEYQPKNLTRDGKWRKIAIKVKQPELISRTRPGYFAN